MKSFKIIVSICIFFLVSISCSDEFLETSPSDGFDVSAVFTTTDNAWGALNGIHRHLYEKYNSDQAYGGQGCIMHALDVMGEDVILPARANGYFIKPTQWLDHTSETGGYTKFVWYFYYKVISNANLIIGNIDGAEGDDSEKNIIKGQAYAYRAWANWMLVQLYGIRYDSDDDNSNLGIPIMTFESSEAKARNTVAEVYEIINLDLDEAITLLEGYDRLNKSHIDQSVAKGFKARVLLTQEQWGDAADMAMDAAEGYSFMSEEEHFEGYNDYTNSEWMWSHKISSDQTITYGSFFGYMGCNYYSRGVKGAPRVINNLLYNQISDTDIRKGKLWIPDPTTTSVLIPDGGSVFEYMHQKFIAESESSSNGCVPCMRVAEMYLIAAEGYARSGDNEKAQKALYDLMITRDPEYTKSTKTGNTLAEDIIIARRIELWGEGFRFLDLKRLDQDLNRYGTNCNSSVAGTTYEVEAGDSRWQWMIPKTSETDANPLIEQNP